MIKPKKPKNANAWKAPARLAAGFRLASACMFALALLLPGAAGAFTLQDIGLSSVPGQTSLKLTFAKGSPSDGEYPLYFQKADPARGTLTLSFLDTDSPFPLGRHAVETQNPSVEEILLKRVTSPSGKEFLGIELRLKEPPTGEAPVQPQPKGSLKVMVGKGSKNKITWSLAKAVKAREAYLTAKAEPAPAPAVPNKVEAQGAPDAVPAPGKAPPVNDRAGKPGSVEPAPHSEAPAATPAPESHSAAPAPEPAESASEPAAAQVPAVLKEIKLAVTRSQEDLALVFDPATSTPVHTAQANPTDSTVLEVILDGVSSGLSRKEYVFPGSALFKKARIASSSKSGNLVLRIQLMGKDPVHILPQEGGLTLTGVGKGEAAVPFKWSSAKPDAPAPAGLDGGPDPVQSAHQDGEGLDAVAGTGKPGKGKSLSSSRVFGLGKGGKNMILLRDSAALRPDPAPKAKAKRKLPLGERVERIDRQGAYIKVVAGGDTGWVKAGEAAYEDEMSEVQVADLKKQIEAVAAKQDAAAKKAEAAAQALAAKEAAAAEKKAAKEAALAAAAAAKEAKAQEAAATEEAEPVRVAGPAAIPSSTPKALQEEAKGKKAPDGPKLSLAENPELANKLAQEKKSAEEEKMKVAPPETRIAYNSYGRRDPFIPVEQGLSDNGIDIDQMKVVGIIWQAQEPMAVLEHNRESGVSFTVKQGDPVHNGRVSRITRDQVTFDISEYGISRSYSLKLVSNKEGKKQ